eukprot:scaffold12.g8157.t1
MREHQRPNRHSRSESRSMELRRHLLPHLRRRQRLAPQGQQAQLPEGPIPPLEPGYDEEQHVHKPQWRRGFRTKEATDWLFITLTPSDCTTKRLRPPRTWFDLLLGGYAPTLEVQTETRAGQISFLLQSVAYDYAKNEYYVQGTETKRMFRALGLQPGDGLKLVVTGRGLANQPLLRMTLRPAATNPHAPSVVGAANAAAARRAAAAATRPKDKEGGRKRKGGPGASSAAAESAAAGAAASAPAAATAAGQLAAHQQQHNSHRPPPYNVDEDWEPEGGRRMRRSLRGPKHGEGHGAAGEAEDQAAKRRRSDPTGAAALGDGAAQQGLPQVTAIHAGSRNLLRIRMPGKGGAPGGGAASGGASAGGSEPGAGEGGGGGALEFLAGLADGMQTPRDGAGAAVPPGARAPAGGEQQAAAAAAGSGVVALLSRALVRDGDGAVTGANCKLSMGAGASVPAICRKLSAWGLQHHEASIEDFEVLPAEQVIKVQMRLQEGAVGKADVLEAAVLDLTDVLGGMADGPAPAAAGNDDLSASLPAWARLTVSADLAAALEAEMAAEWHATLIAQCRFLLSVPACASLPHDPLLGAAPANPTSTITSAKAALAALLAPVTTHAAAAPAPAAPAAVPLWQPAADPADPAPAVLPLPSCSSPPPIPTGGERKRAAATPAARPGPECMLHEAGQPGATTPCTADRPRSCKRARQLLNDTGAPAGTATGAATATTAAPPASSDDDEGSDCDSPCLGSSDELSPIWPGYRVARGLSFTPEQQPKSMHEAGSRTLRDQGLCCGRPAPLVSIKPFELFKGSRSGIEELNARILACAALDGATPAAAAAPGPTAAGRRIISICLTGRG